MGGHAWEREMGSCVEDWMEGRELDIASDFKVRRGEEDEEKEKEKEKDKKRACGGCLSSEGEEVSG